MPVQPGYFEYVLEQLAALPSLRPNRMFGGIGLYSDGIFFGLIDDDTLFFKTNDTNIAAYRERNMPRFMPFPDRPEAVLGYHQVPADVIEDAETLVAWARQSIEVQLASQSAKSTGKAGTEAAAKRATKVRKAKGSANARPDPEAGARARAKARVKVKGKAKGKATAKSNPRARPKARKARKPGRSAQPRRRARR